MADPAGLFAPPRTMRQVRYVEVQTLAVLNRPELAELIREAVHYQSL